MTFLAGEGTDLGRDYTAVRDHRWPRQVRAQRRDKKRVRIDRRARHGVAAGDDA